MGKTNTKAENSKKAQGNARKAAAADKKQQEADARVEAIESEQWSKGSKSNAKKEDAAAKKAEQAAKKAERDAELAKEEASVKTIKTSKQAQKKNVGVPSRGLDLSQLDDKLSDINASGIDNALDALTLTGSSAAADASKVDRHPERRYKAAYAAFEEKRLPELQKENPGLRLNQRKELAHKEFEKHPDNPFNQVNARFDSSGAELKEIAAGERARMERLLTS